ncbi:hypothetical protein WR25_08439 [Diploscapter pachys]|uniref:Carbohydrate kinase PfkB domain-containing protein n=1 Tax=Diploscapter pachys TaxID=2018661 RepID=A0A2A2K734_9BILA|nr:hypothetical protein WR25_08439 [Diploscapter pachys]
MSASGWPNRRTRPAASCPITRSNPALVRRHCRAQDRREQIGERNHEQSRDGKAQHEPLAASRLAPAPHRRIVHVPARHHVAEVAPQQPAIDQEKRDRRPDRGEQQREIDGRHHQIDAQRAHRRRERHPPRPDEPDVAGHGMRGGIVTRLHRGDDRVAEQPDHRDRDHAEQQPGGNDEHDYRQRPRQPVAQRRAQIGEGRVQSTEQRQPEQDKDRHRQRQRLRQHPQYRGVAKLAEREATPPRPGGPRNKSGVTAGTPRPALRETAHAPRERHLTLPELPLSHPTYDVVAIGNAIVDILAQADDAFIESIGVAKGSMQLMFSPEDADALYDRMGPGREVSGGSAANTVAGIAALGGRTGFIGQVADDQLGEVFAHDIRAAGVAFTTDVRPGQPTTARCLIFVTPDGQRTMNTYLGASQFLPAAALDLGMIEDAAILYLEGYLWDPEEPRAAMRVAIEAARKAGRKAQGKGLEESLKLGAICAAEIISHFGARPNVDMKALMAAKLG